MRRRENSELTERRQGRAVRPRPFDSADGTGARLVPVHSAAPGVGLQLQRALGA